jgi:ribosomal protein L34E
MVRRSDRTKKAKFVKTPSKTKKEYFDEAPKKKRCAITNQVLSGTERNIKPIKSSKTQRRPSVPFGGILSSKAREIIFTELAKVTAGIKTIEEVDFKHRKYVKQVEKRVE